MNKAAALIIAAIVVVVIAVAIFLAVYYGESSSIKLANATYFSGVLASGQNLVVVYWGANASSPAKLPKAFQHKALLKTAAFGGKSVSGTIVDTNSTEGWLAFVTSDAVSTSTPGVSMPTAPPAGLNGVLAAISGTSAMDSWTASAGSSDSIRVWYVPA